MKKKYNVLELFAGAGGLALGFHKAGFNNIGLVEIDKYASQTLKNNMKQWNIYDKDINDFISEDLNILKDKVKIDVISGGFPCQSFSYAGKKAGFKDQRGQLFFSFLKTISIVKPKVVVFENVKGLVTHNNGETFKIMKNKIEELGYSIVYKVLNAWDYSVAQKRERVFCIGINKQYDITQFHFPIKHSKKLVLQDIIKNISDANGMQYSESKIKILKLVPPKGCWKNLPDDIAREYMGKSYFLGGGKTGIARRLGWDEPSLTLTTSPMQKQTERCHPDETRPFNILEYALIQSFPINWKFAGSLNQQYKQIGNAVPVNLAYAVGLEIVKFLNLQNN